MLYIVLFLTEHFHFCWLVWDMNIKSGQNGFGIKEKDEPGVLG